MNEVYRKHKDKDWRKFLWNAQSHEFMGRTGQSWVNFLLFYSLFYSLLAFATIGLWFAFEESTLDPKIPKIQGAVGGYPGLGYRPKPMGKYAGSSLITYTSGTNNFLPLTLQLEDFFKDYKNQSYPSGNEEPGKYANCKYGVAPPEGTLCMVNLTQMSPCNAQFYNYDTPSPCVFVKLNKIYNWIPDLYNDTENLPDDMPDVLKEHVKTLKEQKREDELNTVWLTCDGKNQADKENMGTLTMLPYRGFPGHYFPYKNVEGYLSPLVAIWFDSPKRAVIINIECKAWARNIILDEREMRGSVHFELMID